MVHESSCKEFFPRRALQIFIYCGTISPHPNRQLRVRKNCSYGCNLSSRKILNLKHGSLISKANTFPTQKVLHHIKFWLQIQPLGGLQTATSTFHRAPKIAYLSSTLHKELLSFSSATETLSYLKQLISWSSVYSVNIIYHYTRHPTVVGESLQE